MIEIRHRHLGTVLYRADEANMAAALKAAALTGANLTGADLRGANLAGAYLAGANLAGAALDDADLADANLAGAALTGANLAGAYLLGALLTGADLSGADLIDADLRGAKLTRANLDGANLAGANLAGANLTDAKLTDADLTRIRADVEDILDVAPAEVAGLLAALREGRVDGSTYEGECVCLVGTVARLRDVHYDALPGIPPSPRRPAERWFLAIAPGDTPATSQVAEITERWICEWQAAR